MNACKLALAATIALALGAAALPRARAADESAKLTRHDYPQLGFALDVPTAWTEKHEKSGVKWELENKPSTCEVTLWTERKVLDDVEKNLKQKAADNKWTAVEEPKRVKIDGCDAFYMLVDIPKPYPLRQLFAVIDEPQGTYLITYGDLASEFDRPSVDAIVNSFQHVAMVREAASAPTATASAAAPTPGTVAPAPAVEAEREWGCASCNKIWPKTDRFCRDCGGKNGPLPRKVFGCASCKKHYPVGQQFCPDCGAKLSTYTE